MKQKITSWIAALVFVMTMGGATLTIALPQTTYAACNDRLLTFPAWFRGLTDGQCNIKSPTDAGGLPKFVWTIGLNVVELMLQLVGYISVGYIIVGGFKYMTDAGSPDSIVRARKTITNALIGLGISIFSVAIVNIVAESIK